MEGRGVRPVRILLSAALDDRIEEVIASGVGGFRDKHALIGAAIDSYLIELVYANGMAPVSGPDRILAPAATAGSRLPRVQRVVRGAVVDDDAVVLLDEPLLGLHNRDWPSLWALGVLAEMSSEGLVPWRVFLQEVTSRAWEVAEMIAEALPDAARKATALLPTNREKVQSAESAFQTFAVGEVARRLSSAGKFRVSGPLPLWRVMGFTQNAQELMVGVTDNGWDLLDQMADLEPAAPHGQDRSTAFLGYLRRCSHSDWWGFETMLALVARTPTRDEYLARFRSAREWKASVADSAAQGYLARGREWGLVEPKMAEGRYQLTKFGKEVADA